MRAEEFLTEKQLEEINLRKAGANTAFALAAFNAGVTNPIYNHGDERPRTVQAAKDSRKSLGPVARLQTPTPGYEKSNMDPEEAVSKIVKRYKVPPEMALNVVRLAKKYERPDFPKYDDILSVIAIESAFNPKAVSNLKKDPALGLTQVRAKMWGQNPKTFIHDMDQQVKMSAKILDQYNKELNSPLDAVHAYNVGLAGFRKGDLNPSYVEKFKKAKELYK